MTTASLAAPVEEEGVSFSFIERNESYLQLVWRRFRRSKAAIFGGLVVVTLAVLALFADFFAPYPLRPLQRNKSTIM